VLASPWSAQVGKAEGILDMSLAQPLTFTWPKEPEADRIQIGSLEVIEQRSRSWVVDQRMQPASPSVMGRFSGHPSVRITDPTDAWVPCPTTSECGPPIDHASPRVRGPADGGETGWLAEGPSWIASSGE
jgi:hypothetical protein